MAIVLISGFDILFFVFGFKFLEFGGAGLDYIIRSFYKIQSSGFSSS